MPLAEARLSPLDRGFLFGDAVYETIRVRRGVPLWLDEHLARLRASLAGLGIPEPPTLNRAIAELLAASALGDGSLYLQVSRGAPATRRHLPSAPLAPTLFLLPTPVAFPPHPERLPGLTAISRPDWRWGRCDLKTTSLAGPLLGLRDAAAEAADEVLFVSPHGALREGGHTNVFVRRGDRLETAPLGRHLLAGVTRAHLLTLARQAGIAVRERAPRLAELTEWDELLLCGTMTGVRGVVALDGRPIGSGGVGAWTRQLALALEASELAAVGGPG